MPPPPLPPPLPVDTASQSAAQRYACVLGNAYAAGLGGGYGLLACGLGGAGLGASPHAFCLPPSHSAPPTFGANHALGSHAHNGGGYGATGGRHAPHLGSFSSLSLYGQQHGGAAFGAQGGGPTSGHAHAQPGQPPLAYGLHANCSSSLSALSVLHPAAQHAHAHAGSGAHGGAQAGFVGCGAGMPALASMPGHLQAQWQQAQQQQAQQQAPQLAFRSTIASSPSYGCAMPHSGQRRAQ
uniref:Uncharacterized protein n=1 Tax=Diacronema lutheri TaxID=2081491 RepID=A0A7R9UQF0_DIALT|mmetsp:Transcript_1920/g.6247  ORF Transcript_1920/g.6247 Transcript_1920/m.6247 type:complete len:239 (+) Transcript_1920:2-718(+)